MDVDKMKRINALARELREKGMVSDTEEAYKQAEEIIEGRVSREKIEVEDPQDSQEEAERPKEDFSGAIKADALELHNMGERIKALEGQVNVMFNKINEIISEFRSVQKKEEESPIELRKLEEEKESKGKKAHKEVQASLKKEEAEGHPRTGEYKPEDVSIEKVFYFGQR